jgi:Flp pilus assembly protein TadG
MAIVLPVMLLLLSGIIDFGRALQQQLQLTEAVREAARAGAVNGNAVTMQSKVTTLLGSGASLTFNTVTPCNTATPGVDATITVTRAFAPITPLVAMMKYFGTNPTYTITITATGVMGCMG